MKIVAIGGGEIGRPGTRIETEPIDREILRLSGRRHPRLLFVPTASGDAPSYCEVVHDYFGRRLGCQVDDLRLLAEAPSYAAMKQKVSEADIIYVGGGNTLRMLKAWRAHGLDELLIQAARDDTVLAGVSAGAICWFRYGNSDSMKFSDARNPLIRLRGLDLIPLMACPHYDVERTRRPSLRRMIRERGGIAVALENRSAFEVVDGRYLILRTSARAHAYLVFGAQRRAHEQALPSDGKWRALDSLERHALP
jgi:dipeptidase E